MLKYPRTSSSTSSGYFDDDEALMNLNPYQTPPTSPQCCVVPQYLERHMVRMFSTEE
ncbi:GH11672 [Drosophila grimshawi]|uniref:GH11672 n=1 Tax=Drosophila grimshawi TaxID=7222 RepID=B4JCP4_DROGR|nr:GH11672 [Drosophila grimshawi]